MVALRLSLFASLSRGLKGEILSAFFTAYREAFSGAHLKCYKRLLLFKVLFQFFGNYNVTE